MILNIKEGKGFQVIPTTKKDKEFLAKAFGSTKFIQEVKEEELGKFLRGAKIASLRIKISSEEESL